MPNLSREFMDFDYREIDVPLKSIFPKLDFDGVAEKLARLKKDDPHETVFGIARALWNGRYSDLMEENGFWDENYNSFSGHCHQCTPVLGLALKALGFKVAYLECFRIREHFLETGRIEKVPPTEEPNPDMKNEFCRIDRIPYCCLEVEIEGEKFYLTGKHLRPKGYSADALLRPACYIDLVGVFHHPDDASRSGIYLKRVKPKKNPDGIDFDKRVVWMKQTERDPAPELFATFLRMNL